MSEFLAANPPTNQGLPLDHLSRDAEAELGPGFDIDTVGLTPSIHQRVAKVRRTLTRLPKLRTA